MNAGDRDILGVSTPQELLSIQQAVSMTWELLQSREERDEARRLADESRYLELNKAIASLPEQMRAAVHECRDRRCQEVDEQIAPLAAAVKVLSDDRTAQHAVYSWRHRRSTLVVAIAAGCGGVGTAAYYWATALAHLIH